jgi:hypothetical protein
MVLQVNLLGREPVTNALYKAIKLDSKFPQGHLETRNFLSQTATLIVQLIRTLCTSPAWQRRKLGGVILNWGRNCS